MVIYYLSYILTYMSGHKTKLNSKQVHVLKSLFKFRYASAELLAKQKNVSKRSLNNTLTVLMDQGYVSRRYEKTYKLLGKPASYFLAAKGLKLLRDEYGLSQKVLHSMYKNKFLSQNFIDHNLNVATACLNLRAIYQDTFGIFTKSEIADLDYMPDQLPDLYLNRKEPNQDKPNEYLLDIFTDTQFFILKKRIDAYVEHFDSGDWPNSQYPTVLIACPDARTEEKLHKHIQSTLDNNYIDEADLRFMTTSTKSLLDGTRDIWTNYQNKDELLHL